MSLLRFVFVAVIFVLLVLTNGCGNNYIPCGGKVTFDDGTPLTKGTIRFTSSNLMATGIIQSDGTFTLTTLKEGDGLPTGEYSVSIIEAAEETIDPVTSYVISSKPLIDQKFEENETSNIRYSVKPETKEIHIIVTKP
jgi:hypothetical protein